MKKILVFILIVITLSRPAFSNNPILDDETTPSFEQLTRASGLSNMSVSSILQDKYGFLWFGTQGGLNRYDGRSIEVIRNHPFKDDGLLHNLIQTMAYHEEKHELWIGTYQGLSRYDIATETFVNYTDALSNSVVVAIAFDATGDAWVGTLDGLNRINPITHEVTTYEVSSDVVRSILLASNGMLYIATYDGLWFYDATKDALEKRPLDLPNETLMLVKESETGVLTLGLWDGGLIKYHLDTGKLIRHTFEDNRVYAYTQTRDGIEWVGTWGGGLFAILPNGETRHYPGSKSRGDVGHAVIYSLFQSSSDILWVGTNGGGITKINPLKRDYLMLSHEKDNPNALSAGKINLIHRDRSNRLWVGVYNSGIERVLPDGKTTLKYPPNPETNLGNNVMAVLDEAGLPLIFGTSSGLTLYNESSETFEAFDIGLPKDNLIYALAYDPKGILWIGTYREGVYTYDLKSKDIKRYHFVDDGHQTLSDNLVYDILIDSKSRVWVATNNGLNLMTDAAEGFKFFKKVPGNTSSLPSNTLRHLYEDTSGTIWIASVGGGLSRFVEETFDFFSYTESEGLSNNTVMSMVESDDGKLWVATLDGLTVLSKTRDQMDTLSPEDGIGGYEFNGGHYKEADGTMLFGGPHGITALPGQLQFKMPEKPPLYVSQMMVYQNALPLLGSFFNNHTFEFKHSENFIRFEFVALDYDAPDKIEYYHRLLGQNDEWIATANLNTAAYSNLKPGHYTFEVFAKTTRGVATDYASVDFTIKKPWYLTPVAFITYLLLVVVLIQTLFKLRERRLIVEKNTALEQINDQLAKANEQLESLSIKDPLTQVYNRRYFENVIEQQLQLSKRSQIPMGLLMLDIDDFKHINDTYGHIIGDKILMALTQAIEPLLHRSTDFIARFGGDEFIIGLYDTDFDGVMVIANAIQKKLSHLIYVSESQNVRIKITTSIGVYSEVPSLNQTSEGLIHAVDQALYRAKNTGKNKIVSGDAFLAE